MISSRVHVEKISRANERAALDYLARDPYENVYLSHLVRYDHSQATRSGIVAAVESGRVVGVASYGRQLVLASEPEAIDAFAQFTQRHRGERMIVGPRDVVAALWSRLRDRRPPPRIVRDRQFVMALEGGCAQSHSLHGLVVRMANPSDCAGVIESSAQMIEHELDYDPRRTSPDFAAGVRSMIEHGRWWVAEYGGRLAFFCSIGPWCERTTQLQGIWVPPALRGKGIATAALASVCERMLETAPTLSLYVNDFNAPAIALYRRFGFVKVGDRRGYYRKDGGAPAPAWVMRRELV